MHVRQSHKENAADPDSPPAGGRVDIENQRKSLRCAVLQLVYLRLMILQRSNMEIGGAGGRKDKKYQLLLCAFHEFEFLSLSITAAGIASPNFSCATIFSFHDSVAWPGAGATVCTDPTKGAAAYARLLRRDLPWL